MQPGQGSGSRACTASRGSYEQKHFSAEDKRGRLRLIASPDAADGSVLIHQDARVYAGLFDGAETAALRVAEDRRLYVHVARGRVTANGGSRIIDPISCVLHHFLRSP